MSQYNSNTIIDAFLQIEQSYSTVTEPISLDLPDSLNQQKLTYTPPTQAELLQLARQYFEPEYIDKQYEIEASAVKSTNAIQDKIAKADSTLAQKLQEIYIQLVLEDAKIVHDAVDNGIMQSSIVGNMQDKAVQQSEQSESIAQQVNTTTKQQLTLDIAEVAQNRQDALDNLESVIDAEVAVKVLELEQDEQDEQEDIVKYNNTLEEKEQKYQMSRANDIADAEREERDRAVKIAELQLKLGNAGLSDLIAQQKLSLARETVEDMTRQQAQTFLTSAMQSHLGDYYAIFADFVNNL